MHGRAGRVASDQPTSSRDLRSDWSRTTLIRATGHRPLRKSHRYGYCATGAKSVLQLSSRHGCQKRSTTVVAPRVKKALYNCRRATGGKGFQTLCLSQCHEFKGVAPSLRGAKRRSNPVSRGSGLLRYARNDERAPLKFMTLLFITVWTVFTHNRE